MADSIPNRPNMANTGNVFAVVSVSVSTSTSAMAAGVGPFRAIFFKTSATISIIGVNGNTIDLDNYPKNTFFWCQGSFVSAIVTATSQFAIL